MGSTCSEHTSLVTDVATVKEQNKTQFNMIKEAAKDIKDIKREMKGLYNGKMTALLEKVLDQRENERREEIEVRLKEKEIESEKWKSRAKLYPAIASIVTALISIVTILLSR